MQCLGRKGAILFIWVRCLQKCEFQSKVEECNRFVFSWRASGLLLPSNTSRAEVDTFNTWFLQAIFRAVAFLCNPEVGVLNTLVFEVILKAPAHTLVLVCACFSMVGMSSFKQFICRCLLMCVLDSVLSTRWLQAILGACACWVFWFGDEGWTFNTMVSCDLWCCSSVWSYQKYWSSPRRRVERSSASERRSSL